MANEVENTTEWFGIKVLMKDASPLVYAMLLQDFMFRETTENATDYESPFDYQSEGKDKGSQKTGKKTKSIFSKIGDAISDVYNAVEVWAKNIFTSGDDEEDEQSEWV